VLREASAYRQADRIRIKVSDEQASGIQSGLAELAAAYREPGRPSDSADCSSVAMSVEQRIKLDLSEVLSIVESEIAANQNCACEIVKTAIKASGADEALVGDITEVAITNAPQSMRMISQCAIAAMPEALASVQAVLAKLDPNSGNTKSANSGKDAKAAVASELTPPEEPPDPLDLPPPPFPPLPPPPLPPPPLPPPPRDFPPDLPPADVTDPNP
jgi:predicted RecA/RadA family phage recombinase